MTLAVTLIVLIVIGTVIYSAYEDYTAVRPYLSGSQGPVGTAQVVGDSEVITLNITLPNRGFYTLNVSVSCSSPNSNIVCQNASLAVPAGQQGVLRFKMTVVNLQQYTSSGSQRINGTVAISLEPFVSLSVGVNFGGLIGTGGG